MTNDIDDDDSDGDDDDGDVDDDNGDDEHDDGDDSVSASMIFISFAIHHHRSSFVVVLLIIIVIYILNPCDRKHTLCALMNSSHCSWPYRTTHSSRGTRVSGHAQQIFNPLTGDTAGADVAGVTAVAGAGDFTAATAATEAEDDATLHMMRGGDNEEIDVRE